MALLTKYGSEIDPEPETALGAACATHTSKPSFSSKKESSRDWLMLNGSKTKASSIISLYQERGRPRPRIDPSFQPADVGVRASIYGEPPRRFGAHRPEAGPWIGNPRLKIGIGQGGPEAGVHGKGLSGRSAVWQTGLRIGARDRNRPQSSCGPT